MAAPFFIVATIRAMSGESELSLFQKVLLATDGTVTDLVALYAGEPIHVRKLAQSISEQGCPPELGLDGPARLLTRTILLCSATTNYLHAESQFVLARLSSTIQRQLLESDRPIGLLWKQERFESFREIIRQSIQPCPTIAVHFALPESTRFVSRTYLIHHQAKPLGMITERWPICHFR